VPAVPAPDLRVEASLLADGHRLVGGVDEVGRGAWAGPLVVGVVVLDGTTGPLPEGTNDSKKLTAPARRALRPRLEAWCAGWALGVVSAREIDEEGLAEAMRVAVARALDRLAEPPSALIVDGRVDITGGATSSTHHGAEVHPMVGADHRCGSVAAASVLAKVARDRWMTSLSRRHPAYGFDQHVGYGTAAHRAAIRVHGLTAHHRRSWAFGDRVGLEDIANAQ